MKKVILFEGSDWCKSSRVMKSLVKEMTDKFEDIKFVSVNVDTEEGAEESVKNKVRNVPVMIFRNDGKEIMRIKGKISKQELSNKLESWK